MEEYLYTYQNIYKYNDYRKIMLLFFFILIIIYILVIFHIYLKNKFKK